MKARYKKGVANRLDPESCVLYREMWGEALTGDTDRPAIWDKLVKKRHEPIKQVGAWLKRVMRGYFNYHAVPDNLKRLKDFRHAVCRAWFKQLRRRSALRYDPRQEPCAVIPLAGICAGGVG